MASDLRDLLDLDPDRDRRRRAGRRSCYNCVHLHKDWESWEMPHIQWYECYPRPAAMNLTTYPFLNTKCKAWKGAADGE